MSTELDATIVDAAKGPKRVVVDGNAADQHNLKDLIAAAKYDAAQDVIKAGGWGMRLAQIQPGGTV